MVNIADEPLARAMHESRRKFADRYCRTEDRVVFPAAQGAQGK